MTYWPSNLPNGPPSDLVPCYIHSLTRSDKSHRPAASSTPTPLRPHLAPWISLLSHSNSLALISPAAERQASGTAYLHREPHPELKHPTLRLSLIRRFTAQIKRYFSRIKTTSFHGPVSTTPPLIRTAQEHGCTLHLRDEELGTTRG